MPPEQIEEYLSEVHPVFVHWHLSSRLCIVISPVDQADE